MGKTLRKFSNKDKKTKRKRSYKKGGGREAWVNLYRDIRYGLNRLKESNATSQYYPMILHELYVDLDKPKKSCKETSYYLKRNEKNEQCEALKYLEYDLLRRNMIKRREKLSQPDKNDPKMNIVLYEIDRIIGITTEKMQHNRSKEQTIDYLNKLTEENIKYYNNQIKQTEDQSFMIRRYLEFFIDNVPHHIDNGLINNELNKLAREKRDKENKIKEKNEAEIEQAKQQAENKIKQKNAIEQLKNEGYQMCKFSPEMTTIIKPNDFKTGAYTYKSINGKNDIVELGTFNKITMETVELPSYIEQDYDSMRGAPTKKNKQVYHFEKEKITFPDELHTIFYKGDESTGGKKKYKKSRKTARRGRKTSGGMLFSPSCKDERSLIQVRECLQGKILRDLNKTHDNDSQLKDWQTRSDGNWATGPIDPASDTYNKIDKHFRQLKQTISINNPDDKLKKLKFLETDRILEAYKKWQVERLENREGELRTELNDLSKLIKYI